MDVKNESNQLVQLPPIWERILDKLVSGKFVWTAVGAAVFYKLAVSGKLDTKDCLLILMVIINFYFTKAPDYQGLSLTKSDKNKLETNSIVTEDSLVDDPSKSTVIRPEDKK